MKKRISNLLGSKGVKGVFGAGMAMALLLGSVPAVSAVETTADTNKTCATPSGINPMGQATPIGSKDGYTIFVKDHAILANSELEGTLAAGGKATFGDPRGNQNGQYPIFHGGVGGNANYDVPTIDGVPNRVLIQEFESTNKVVQIQTRGATGDNLKTGGKIADQTKPTGYTFGPQFGESGSTYFPADGGNQSPQIDSVTQPFTTVEAAQESWGTNDKSVLSYFPADQGGILSTYDHWADVDAPAGNDQTVTLNGTEPSKLNLSEFKNYSTFKLEGYSETSFLVIKASPADVKNGVLTLPSYSYPGKEGAEKEGISHILFDLSAITGNVTITSPDQPTRGSIYAPNANITLPPESEGGKEFEGQIIAQNFTALQGGKEMHTNLFHGRFPGSEGGDCGGFSLEKKLSGVDAADVPADAVFSITAQWTDADGKSVTQDFKLKADGTVVDGPQDLPVGTEVTFTEPTAPSVKGYTFDNVTFSSPNGKPAKDTYTVTIAKDQKAAVTATNTYKKVEKPVGGFSLEKKLSGVDAADVPADAVFSITAQWTDADGKSVTQDFELNADGTVVDGPQDLPVGTEVTFTEPTAPSVKGYTFDNVTFSSPNGEPAKDTYTVTIAKGQKAAVTATNTYTQDVPPAPSKGKVKVTKQVDGTGKDLVEDKEFSFTAVCTPPETNEDVEGPQGEEVQPLVDVLQTLGESAAQPLEFDFKLKPNETWDKEIPAGYTCVVTEDAPEAIEGATFDGVTWNPASSDEASSDSVTVADGETAMFTAKNTYTKEEAPVGGFSLEKKLTGVEATDAPSDAVFKITAKWTIDGVEASKVFDLKADGTVVDGPQDLPVGTEVTFSEPEAPAIDGFEWKDVKFSPEKVTIVKDEKAAVTATNTYTKKEAPVGGFSLEKKLAGVDAAAFPEGTVFKVTAKWTIDGVEDSKVFDLKADGTVVDGPQDLPVGTEVTFSEPEAPAIDGFEWNDVKFSPEKVTIVKDEKAAVTATNTYTPTGDIVVEKKVTGPKGAEVTADKDAVFQIKASWTKDGKTKEKLFNVTPGKPVSLTGLPLNTDITLSEVGAETSVENVKWGDIIWSGEGVVDEPGASKDATLKIKDGSKPVSVGLENKTSSNGLIIIPIPLPGIPDLPGSSTPPGPNVPVTPGQPTEPGKPGQPTEPSKPGKPGQPTEPAKPTQPGKPGQPASNGSKGSGLANTGADVILLAGGALLLLLGGACLVLRARKQES